MLINLSKEYTTTVNYKILYEKLPQHKVFQEEPLKEIDLLVKASGFKLLSSNFHNKNLIFYLDKIRNTSEKQYYILPRDQKRIVQTQLYKGLRLESFLKDTIFLKLGSLSSKKVPVGEQKINSDGSVTIGKGSWIGTNSVIYGGRKNGITIGKNCVIAANTFVDFNVPDYSLVTNKKTIETMLIK